MNLKIITVEPRNNSLAFKGSPSIKVNILRSQIVVFNVISPLFKGYPEKKVKNLQSQWDRWGGVLLYLQLSNVTDNMFKGKRASRR